MLGWETGLIKKNCYYILYGAVATLSTLRSPALFLTAPRSSHTHLNGPRCYLLVSFLSI